MSYSYWKREDTDGTIYFATEADSPAEGAAQNDKRALAISKEEYEANVPAAVHNGQDRNAEEVDPKDAAWHNLLMWQKGAGIPLPDQVAMLELVSFNLKMAFSQSMIRPEVKNNVA